MAGNLVFSDRQTIDQSDLFPKAELFQSEDRLVVHTKDVKTTIEIQDATDYDVALLESNGVIVSKLP